jgi:hypothetical protein
MEITGDSSGFVRGLENEVFRSPPVKVKERRMEPKAANEFLGASGAVGETAVACLPGPNGNRLRRARKPGIPELELCPPLVLAVDIEAGLEEIRLLEDLRNEGMNFGEGVDISTVRVG